MSKKREESKPIAGLIQGRTVHYVMDTPLAAGESPKVRPATVVVVNDAATGSSNLQVFVDGTNDGYGPGQGTVWKPSSVYSEGREPGTWHWPPRG